MKIFFYFLSRLCLEKRQATKRLLSFAPR